MIDWERLVTEKIPDVAPYLDKMSSDIKTLEKWLGARAPFGASIDVKGLGALSWGKAESGGSMRVLLGVTPLAERGVADRIAAWPHLPKLVEAVATRSAEMIEKLKAVLEGAYVSD